jgi:hypothetical protein
MANGLDNGTLYLYNLGVHLIIGVHHLLIFQLSITDVVKWALTVYPVRHADYGRYILNPSNGLG